MLFQPWRDETEIIGSSETYLEQFRQLTLENQTIITKMEEYSYKSKELDDAVEKLEEIDDSVLQEQWNHVAPNTHNVENQDGEVKVILPHSHTDPEYNSPEAVELNIGLDVPNTADKESIVINMMKDEDYLSLVRSLNIKQTECFYFVTDKIKNSPHEAFHVFLTGGTGVGKTTVTNAIYQMAIRYLNKRPGQPQII
jgi:flagellar biosynthesis GTPase FlhF